MITPVFIVTFFILFQWWRIEEKRLKRIMTFPLVLLLCWPQYRVARILYLGLWKQISQWRKENDIVKKEIGNLGKIFFTSFRKGIYLLLVSEPFLEAVPQLHILFTLWWLDSWVTMGQYPKLFIATFSSSILTASLGIAKFMKVGPCRLVPDEGKIGGYGNPCFILLVFDIALTLVSKGSLLFVLESLPLPFRLESHANAVIIAWVIICYFPYLVYVSAIIDKLFQQHKKCFHQIIISFLGNVNHDNEHWIQESNSNDISVSWSHSNTYIFSLDIW